MSEEKSGSAKTQRFLSFTFIIVILLIAGLCCLANISCKPTSNIPSETCINLPKGQKFVQLQTQPTTGQISILTTNLEEDEEPKTYSLLKQGLKLQYKIVESR